MMNLDSVYRVEYGEDVDAVKSWVDNLYNTRFSSEFSCVSELYHAMQSKSRTISDAELEEILTDLPLRLFKVSESLNDLRLEYEVMKLKYKQKRLEQSKSLADKKGLTATLRNELIDSALVEDNILLSAISSVISRVQDSISLSRELIMGAKKVWDSRRRAESANPVSEVISDNIPPYSRDNFSGKQYVK